MSKAKNKSKKKKLAKQKTANQKTRSEVDTYHDDFPACQIYLITPPTIEDVDAFANTLEKVLAAVSIGCVQIRLKDTSDENIIAISERLVPLCHAHGTMVLINDSPEIAAHTGADGVHLGQSDMDINLAKNMLGADAIIGVTCHNSRELAFKAGSDDASYVAFGAFFESTTKPEAKLADLEILSWWNEAIEIPCVAIGGITTANAQSVIAAGANFIALSSGVWNHPKGAVQAVQELHALCEAHTPPPL
ncbi:MAG: thiamine phosphate synthase [Robiginitomaculum sp.]|nr:MAG: thiamine phosphate synthase [Robiginitomaculum sp.]